MVVPKHGRFIKSIRIPFTIPYPMNMYTPYPMYVCGLQNNSTEKKSPKKKKEGNSVRPWLLLQFPPPGPCRESLP